MLNFSGVEYYIIITCIFVVVYWITPRKYVWVSFLLTTILLSILAYNIMFYDSDDMMVYFHHIDVFRRDGKDGLDLALQENWFEWKTYISSRYYIYSIKFLPNNYYLPAITIFIAYFLGFLVLYKASIRFEISKPYLFFAAMIFLSTYWYYDIVSGVRNGLAFAIAFACSYQDFVERRHIPLCYIGYFIAATMHSSGIVAVLIVFICKLTLEYNSKFINFIIIFGLSAGGMLVKWLAQRTDNSFIQSIAGRAENHGLSDHLETGTMFLVNLSFLVFTTLIFWYLNRYVKGGVNSGAMNRLNKYCSTFLCFMYGCALSGLVFVRFARWILPLVCGLIIMIGFCNQKQYYENALYADGTSRYAPIQSMNVKFRPVMLLLAMIYFAVHYWYLCNGSSLHWIQLQP